MGACDHNPAPIRAQTTVSQSPRDGSLFDAAARLEEEEKQDSTALAHLARLIRALIRLGADPSLTSNSRLQRRIDAARSAAYRDSQYSSEQVGLAPATRRASFLEYLDAVESDIQVWNTDGLFIGTGEGEEPGEDDEDGHGTDDLCHDPPVTYGKMHFAAASAAVLEREALDCLCKLDK